METPKYIGFIGLGNMGFLMASRLVNAGYALTVYDMKRDVLTAFLKTYKAKAADSPAEVATHNNIVITMLPDGKAVSTAVLGSETSAGMIVNMAPGSILVDMSSSAPMGTRKLGELLATRGVYMVDAPVSGGVPKAQSGELAVIAGGDPEVIERCRPVFEVVGSRIFPLSFLSGWNDLQACSGKASGSRDSTLGAGPTLHRI